MNQQTFGHETPKPAKVFLKLYNTHSKRPKIFKKKKKRKKNKIKLNYTNKKRTPLLFPQPNLLLFNNLLSFYYIHIYRKNRDTESTYKCASLLSLCVCARESLLLLWLSNSGLVFKIQGGLLKKKVPKIETLCGVF